jgi:hypothetical protein
MLLRIVPANHRIGPQNRWVEALAKGLTLLPKKTKLVEFSLYLHRHAGKRGRKRPETIYFLGFTLYCTRNRKGNFRIGQAGIARVRVRKQ